MQLMPEYNKKYEKHVILAIRSIQLFHPRVMSSPLQIVHTEYIIA